MINMRTIYEQTVPSRATVINSAAMNIGVLVSLSLLVFSVCKRWLGEGRSLSVATEITVLFPFPAKVLLWTVTSEVTNSLRPAESFSLQIYSKRTAVLGARADGKYFRLASQMVSVLAMQPWHCSVKSATVNMWMNGCRCVPVKLYL